MSKVKITEKQASDIEFRKQNFSNESTIKKHLEGWEKLIILNSLTLDELIRALYIGYEVEPEFKKNDWVHVSFKGTSKIAKILNSYRGVIQFYDNENLPNIKIGNQTRHATSEEIAEVKQRRFWHENGRKFGEYKVNDVLTTGDSKCAWVITDVLGATDGSSLYRLDNDIETTHKKAVFLDRFNVVCFAHDRKDLKND